MPYSARSHPTRHVNSILLAALLLVGTPGKVLSGGAHHGNEFEGGSSASSPTAIEVDAQTIRRLGIEIEPVAREFMDLGIKATGQIETLPNQKVEVTAPIAGKVVQLLVEPGNSVSRGQIVAILLSPQLSDLRVESLQRRAEAEADVREAQANLELARENYQRQVEIAEAEIAQAETELEVARTRYERDKSLVDEGAVLAVARENYQRQVEIAEAEIAQTETELVVSQEQYDRDKELVEAGAIPRRQMLESQARLATAKAEAARAKSRRDVLDAQFEVKRAEVDLPLRDLRESEDLLARAKAQLTRANQRQNVLEAETEIKRAKAALSAANSRLELSDTAYQTRLQQIGTNANKDGTVLVSAPISGVVSQRNITLGQSVDESGVALMTIQDDTRVWATANIYEKDLSRVEIGQRTNVKVASFPDRAFRGRISYIGSTVEGETRAVPVRAEIENIDGELKPGMFAELEIVTERSPAAVMSVPASAVVDANGLDTIYVQNGQQFEPIEVTLGQTFGDRVEVKSGLFDGDRVVTVGGMQLYAQSLRGGGHKDDEEESQHEHGEEATGHGDASEAAEASGKLFGLMLPGYSLPWWWLLPGAGAIAAGAFWAGRYSKPQLASASTARFSDLSDLNSGDLPENNDGEAYEIPALAESGDRAEINK